MIKNKLNSFMRLLVSLLVLLLCVSEAYAQNVFTVTKTSDPDPFLYSVDPNDPVIVGTLQWAIRQVNNVTTPGINIIDFAIPGTGPHVITLTYELPQVSGSVTLDATTQPGYSANTPVVIIDGQGQRVTCFSIASSNPASSNAFNIKGFYIKNFSYTGISTHQLNDFEITNNVINHIGNTCILVECSSNGSIQGNILGTDNTESLMPASTVGIRFTGSCSGSNASSSNDVGGVLPGHANLIKNTIYGIGVNPGCNNNRFMRNKIYGNTAAIEFGTGNGNSSKAMPVITSIASSTVATGTSHPEDVIEVFTGNGAQDAYEYLATTITDAFGNWSVPVTNTHPVVTATATDIYRNTSELATTGCDFSVAPSGILINPDGTLICTAGEIKTLTVNGGSLAAGASWVWYTNGCAVTPIGTGPSIQVSPTTTTVYYVRAEGTCNTTPCLSTTIIVPSNPLIISGPATVCAGGTAVLTAAGSRKGDYVWSPATGLSSTTGSTITATVNVTTTYTLNSGGYCPSYYLLTVVPCSLDCAEDKAICKGESTVLNICGGDNNNYTWSPATGLSSTTGSSVTANPVATTVYTVTGTAGGNVVTRNITVTVYQPPVATITALTDCITTDINFIGSGNSYNGPLSYSWQFGDGHTSSQQNPSHHYTQPGQYLTILTVNDGFCTYICSLYVKAGTPQAFFNAGHVCLGAPLVVTNVTAGATSYLWDFGNGNTSASQYPQHFYTAAGSYTVTLTVTTDNCTSTITRTIQVATPVSNASFTANPDPACIGAPISFINTSSGDATQFLWTFGDGNQSNVQDPTHTFASAPPAPGYYIVTLKASNGGCYKEAIKFITVKPAPTVSIVGAAIVCDGSTTSLSAIIGNISAPSSQYTYQWSINTGSGTQPVTAALGGNLPVLPVSVSGAYSVTVTDGCGQQATATHTINVVNLPNATVALVSGTTCAGLNDGSATVTGLASGDAVTWNPSLETTPTATALAQGVNQVTINNGQCSKVLTINVPYAGPSLSVSTTPAGCNTGSTLGTATAALINGTASSYTWINAQSTVIGNSSSLSNLAIGIYNVTVTDNAGCVLSSPLQITPPILSISISNTQACAGSTASVTATANITGPNPFSGTLTWNAMSGNTVGAQVATGNAAILASGTYRITATDNVYQCTTFTDFIIAPAPPIAIAVTSENPKCHGGLTGSVTAAVSGGTGPYSYEWTKGSSVVSTGQAAEDIGAGTYDITVTDAAGCEHTETVTLSEPLPFTATHSFDGAVPCQMSAAVVNGTFGYMFKWIRTKDETGADIPDNTEDVTNSQTGSTVASGLPLGYYIVEVTDTNGCVAYSNTEVSTGTRPPRTFTLRYAWQRPVETIEEEEEPIEEEIVELVEEMKSDMAKQLARCQDLMESSINQSIEVSCLSGNNFRDEVSVIYNLPYHHYTLYYYDRAGNLTKTVPPEGVDFLSIAEINAILSYRYGALATTPPTATLPGHTFKTMYAYNSLAQLNEQSTPDGGTTQFKYNGLAQLRYSQNAKQLLLNDYSYTKYDYLGRITEVGENTMPAGDLLASLDADNLVFPTLNNRQVTITGYTEPAAVDYNGKQQRFLTNRVSHSFTDKDGDLTTLGDRAETFYSYDPHGNVEWLVQDIPGFSKNYMAYDYDLISGNVLKVRFNENRLDRFFHRYSYDEDNRIKQVETSRNGWLWDKDASYDYYAHGPLRRTNIGEDKIQGIDHVYTIEGWLKSINTPLMASNDDPGHDGDASSAYLKDVFGMSLGYYQGDFIRRHNTSISSLNTINNYASTNKDLYNGNISSWTTNTDLTNVTGGPTAFAYGDKMKGEVYTYDQLNRIKQSEFLSSPTGASWTPTTNFATSYSYDANGNIQTLDRNDQSAQMDDLGYTYLAGTNKLVSVNDASSSQTPGSLYGTHNYTYDAIGNLISESGTEIINGTPTSVSSTITWNVYNKIESVNKTTGADQMTINFAYDAGGNRISKEVIPQTGIPTITYYVRDASGNVMGTYERKNRLTTASEPGYPTGYAADYYLREEPIYGSARIGQVINTGDTEYKIGTATFSNNAGNNVDFLASGIMQASELKNWISPSVKKYNLTASTEACDCKVRSAGFTGTNNAYAAPATIAEFMGDAGNGVSVAEDIQGNLKFYAVTAKSYFGNSNVCLLYDVNGDLMDNSSGINATAQGKPVIMKRPGANNEYCLFTTGIDGKPYMHIVDMNQMGYGTSTSMGKVTQKNIALDNTGNYGLHATALEDAVTGINYMYTTRYIQPLTAADPGTTEVIAFEFAAGVTNPTPEVMATIAGKDETGNGEIQLSKDGKQLAYYSRKKHVGGFAHRETELTVLTINPNNRKAIMPLLTKVVADNGAGTIGKASMDFSSQTGSLYLDQHGVYMQSYGPGLLSEKNIFQYAIGNINPITGRALANTMNISNIIQYGETRRGMDGLMYIAGKENDANFTTLNGLTGATAMLDVNAEYNLTGSLPVQPFKFGATEVPEPIVRTVGDKVYELNDHLGNVRAVISDRRGADVSGSTIVNYADIVTFTDYYGGGAPMPGRNFNQTSYRYGYNKGSEKDDEISGVGNHFTTEFREGDTRLLIWWGVDPKPRASLSPYSYMDGNSILLNDPDGDCPPGSPCAGGQVGLSFKLGTKQNRIGVTAGGFAGFGSTEASGSISLFGNASSFGRKGGSFEMQLTGGLTQGLGGQTSSNQPHDFSIGANNTGRAGSLSLYTTAYFGTGGTNQRVAGFGFTVGNLKATVEDDYLPLFASKDKIGFPAFGDAKDRFRSAAVNVEYKLNNDFTAVGGFKLFTGDPRLYGKAESAPSGFSGAYNSVGPYSTGILYGGLRSGNYTAIGGWNSEKIRLGIQNGFHKLPFVQSPYVPPVQGGGVSKAFLEIGTNSGTTSY